MRTLVASAVLISTMGLFLPSAASAVSIYFSEADFLAAASIESTSTFDNFETNWGFTDQNVALDGVMYSAEACTNRCWTFDGGFGLTPTNIFASNQITDNILSFGTRRYTESLGMKFVSPGNSFNGLPPSWEVTVLETDGSSTQFSISGQFNYAPGFAPLYLGFISDTGIEQVLFADDPSDNFAFNWGFDDVSRGAIVSHPGEGGGQGRVLQDCSPVPPPALGGPSGVPAGVSCIQGESKFPFPRSASVPEPSVLWLVGVGFGGLAVMGRKRRNS